MANGISEWSAHGGIASRGVLLDIYSYCESHGMSYNPWTTFGISLETIKACIEHQKVKFRKGDIVIFRTGYHQRYNKATDGERERKSALNPPEYAGIAQDLAIVEWIYNNKFAAVAGDAPAFESWPPKQMSSGHFLHEILLAGWGMPIGELWYLEHLQKTCKDLGRWSFFLTSSPLNVPGGVATPPNVMALF